MCVAITKAKGHEDDFDGCECNKLTFGAATVAIDLSEIGKKRGQKAIKAHTNTIKRMVREKRQFAWNMVAISTQSNLMP